MAESFPESRFVDARHLSELLKVSPRTISRRVADGTLSPYRFGGRRLFDPREVEAAIRRSRVTD